MIFHIHKSRLTWFGLPDIACSTYHAA